jgi:chemotaxis protein histidine kinase CheA
VLVSIGDDGPGVDWDTIAARARERGMPHANHADLVAALFCDGISTRRESSAISGRGVGLGALQTMVRQLGGQTEIETVADGGTTFRFLLPESMLLDDGTASGGDDRGGRAAAAGAGPGGHDARGA